MKKKIGVFLAVWLLLCSAVPFSCFAASWASAGLELVFEQVIDETQSEQVTFAQEETVYGEALPGTKITIDVTGETQSSTQVILVGASGIFDGTIPFFEGENTVSIQAEYGLRTKELCTVQVERMPMAVKQELERMITLPGLFFSIKL